MAGVGNGEGHFEKCLDLVVGLVTRACEGGSSRIMAEAYEGNALEVLSGSQVVS